MLPQLQLVENFRAVFSLIVGRPVLPGIMEFLDKVVRCPLRNDTTLGPDSADVRVHAVLGHGAVVQTVKTVWKFRSCSSWKVVDTPVFAQRLISMVQVAPKTIEIPQFIHTVDVPVELVVQVLSHKVVDVPVVVQRQVLGLTVQKAVLVPKLPVFAGPWLEALKRQSSPHVEKTVKIPQLQLVGGAVLG